MPKSLCRIDARVTQSAPKRRRRSSTISSRLSVFQLLRSLGLKRRAAPAGFFRRGELGAGEGEHADGLIQIPGGGQKRESRIKQVLLKIGGMRQGPLAGDVG